MSGFDGFSKLGPGEKRRRLSETGYLSAGNDLLFESLLPADSALAATLTGMTENVVSAYPLPYSIAPGFVINGREYAVPMVTEESSVVAAASWSARYWAERGGFNAEVVSEIKTGQVHFTWPGDPGLLILHSPALFGRLRSL